MLSVLGGNYIAQHILQSYRAEMEHKAWMNYMADALYCVGNNRRMTKRFTELYPDFFGFPKKEETRSAEEIINSISNKLSKIGGEQ